MTATYFTEKEARAKKGKKVKTRMEFPDVPVGSIGTITGYYSLISPGLFGVDITWDLPECRRPIVDGFSKDEYVEYLEEI